MADGPLAELITVQEAADRLAVSRWMIYRLIWENRLASVQIGRCRQLFGSPSTTLPPPDGEVERDRLLRHLNDDLRVGAERAEVGRQGADQHVVLALNLADMSLSDTEIRCELNLRHTGGSAKVGEVKH